MYMIRRGEIYGYKLEIERAIYRIRKRVCTASLQLEEIQSKL